MKKCPICDNQIEEWEILCNNCWQKAKQTHELEKLENGEIIERLKGKAKSDLMDIMRELCRKCPKFQIDLTDSACSSCAWKEKEKLIRAFVE